MSAIDIAITGASGFVGQHVVARLREAGSSVRALVRDPAASPLEGVDIVAGDLASAPALAALCAGARAVIHCAGVLAASATKAFEDANVTGTANMVAAAREAGVERFVHLSSLAAREPGLSDYAATKRAGEQEVRTAAGLSWIIVRPPAVYGPGDKATLPLIRQLTQRLALVPGSRSGRASLVHVRDLARALVDLASKREPEGAIFEIDDGRRDGYSWREMASLSAKMSGRSVSCVFLPKGAISLAGRVEQRLASWGGRAPQITPGKAAELYHPDWVCRNRLLQEHTDWAPQISFEDGLRETVEWYRRAGWL
jgi:nucleoside-diphosphate-sugar epimerase